MPARPAGLLTRRKNLFFVSNLQWASTLFYLFSLAVVRFILFSLSPKGFISSIPNPHLLSEWLLEGRSSHTQLIDEGKELYRLLLPLLMGNKLLAWLILSKMSVYWSYLMSCQTWKQNIAFLLTPLLKHITCPVRSLTLTAPLIHSILSFRHRIPLFPRVNYPAPCLDNKRKASFRSCFSRYFVIEGFQTSYPLSSSTPYLNRYRVASP